MLLPFWYAFFDTFLYFPHHVGCHFPVSEASTLIHISPLIRV